LQVEESPLVKQATAIRDVNRVLETRNSEQEARETASLPTIGSVPETPQTPISALRQSVVTPTFEELTTPPEAAVPATPVSALRQQVMRRRDNPEGYFPGTDIPRPPRDGRRDSLANYNAKYGKVAGDLARKEEEERKEFYRVRGRNAVRPVNRTPSPTRTY
jgi:hypothetical protein